jgi:amidophosphoribosyltransferase
MLPPSVAPSICVISSSGPWTVLGCSQVAEGKPHPCLFEYIYIARPDSVINDIHVYQFQLELGKRLAARIRCDSLPCTSVHDLDESIACVF